ncbi:type VI secretion system-associated protein TagF [Telluria mixta]|uniref:Type VI secretion system-associated protein TagF n=1 Tax=Telluria mixta TaxID=34071 RepID=A0ABT2BZ89_9BURK|nr:type VI secretion system-associated protein TagF [Telluria mixta]MCS0630460.1 type VI secretion system-associated protein TagF [Telluria mixta]WEM94237.1 type VI secretion system-associated protein TagF [Telluria mixta]
MSLASTPVSIGYFGKIPSRGDFVKGSDNPALVKLLDDWLARAMDLMTADAHWKANYDAVAPLHFVIAGPRRRHAIAGHIVASSDESGRRFPFLMMGMLDVAEPGAFVPSAPLLLGFLWNRLESLSKGLVTAVDADAPLRAAAGQVLELDLRADAHAPAFTDFIELQSLDTLQALLAQAGYAGSVRRVLLALGMLLQPVLASSTSRLEKSLVLPLPADPLYRGLVGAYWMHAIAPFLARADFELALFVTRIDARPRLVLGFGGASAQTLQAIMDPQAGSERYIAFDDLDWVEDQVDTDYAVEKVSRHLKRSDVSLKSALDALCAAFIGT